MNVVAEPVVVVELPARREFYVFVVELGADGAPVSSGYGRGGTTGHDDRGAALCQRNATENDREKMKSACAYQP